MRYTLLLNADYKPLQIITWCKAMHLLFAERDSAVLMEPYVSGNGVMYARSTNAQFPMPAIIVLKRYVKASRQGVRLSNRNIHLRDNFTCQYTGRRLSSKELSVDHIVPISRGGKSTWDNMVTCCKEINLRKGSKSPDQMGLSLINAPKKPDWYRFLVRRVMLSNNTIWKSYLELIQDPDAIKIQSSDKVS